MKKLTTLAMAMLLVLTLALTGCNQTGNEGNLEVPEENLDYGLVYADLLEEYYEAITTEGDVRDKEGFGGVADVKAYVDFIDVQSSIGYIIEDLNDDGVAELIIGEPYEVVNENRYLGENILALYTCIDGKPTLVFEGWDRNRYTYIGNGKFENIGSGGAASTGFGTFVLPKNGAELECEDFYFSDFNPDDFTEIYYYKNNDGNWDRQNSEKLDISEDDFMELLANRENAAKTLEFNIFMHYNDSEIKVKSLGENVKSTDKVITLHPESSSCQTALKFTAGHEVKDIKFMDLEFVDVDENDQPIFNEKVVYELEKINPENPAVVCVAFLGDIPNLGISYTDKDGNTKKYTVSESGFDGTVILNQYY